MSDKWFEQPLCLADLVFSARTDIVKVSPAECAETKARLHFNAEHLGAMDTEGGEKGVFFFRSSAAREIKADFLGPYLTEAHQRGLRVLIYFNVHWLQSEFGALHPDWVQLDSSRTVIDNLYGRGMCPCVNSPGYRDWSFQVIRDLGQYEIDGIFLDGPIFATNGCWCTACAQGFREATGWELPAGQNWDDPAWRSFIEFRYDSIARYMRDSREALRSARPQAIIYMNCQGLWPSWPNGRDNRRLVEHQDLLGAEGGFIYGDLTQVPLWKPAMSAKLLETQAGGKPTVIFIAGAHKSWDNYLLTPAETRLLYAGTIAHGASPWYGISYDTASAPGALATGEMNAFIRKHSDLLAGTRSVANIALLWSGRTADYMRATVPVTDFTGQGDTGKRVRAGDHFRAMSGAFDALTRSHLLFDVLDEQAIAEGALRRYQVLFLPGCACMSAALAESIREWVSAGGALIASHETSCYGEWGDARGDFQLADVLGVTRRDDPVGPFVMDYLDLTVEHPLTDTLSMRRLPSPEFQLPVSITTAHPLAHFREPLPARYQPLPPLSDRPAITLNEFGKGWALYLAGTFEEGYTSVKHPDYRRLWERMLDWRVLRQVIVERAPQSVQLSLRRQPSGKLLLYLVNYTGAMTRPIEEVTPVCDIAIRLPGVPASARVRALVSEADLASQPGEGLSFVLPRLELYEVCVIES